MDFARQIFALSSFAIVAGCNSPSSGIPGVDGGYADAGHADAGTGGDGGGADGGISCFHQLCTMYGRCPLAWLNLSMISPDAGTLGCEAVRASLRQGDVTVTGRTIDAGVGELAVVGCSSAAGDCGRFIVTASLAGDAGASPIPRIPEGTNVQVRFRFSGNGFGCASTVTVVDAPMPNSVWFAAGSGTYQMEGTLPFEVNDALVGCSPARDCAGGIADDRKLIFLPKDANLRPLYLGSGESGRLEVGGGSRGLLVRNYRSYQGIMCDDYWNFHFAATGLTGE